MKKPRNAPEYRLAKENPMFAPETTALIRFAFFKVAVPCGLCGRKSKRHWTTPDKIAEPGEPPFMDAKIEIR